MFVLLPTLHVYKLEIPSVNVGAPERRHVTQPPRHQEERRRPQPPHLPVIVR